METNLSDTSVVSMQKFTLYLERNVEEFKDTNIHCTCIRFRKYGK